MATILRLVTPAIPVPSWLALVKSPESTTGLSIPGKATATALFRYVLVL
jgi:hypothetical protein